MPNVIRNTGDPKNTITVDGVPVHRENMIFLSTYNQWFAVLNTSLHFCYKDPVIRTGKSTLFCTCGSPAAVFGYTAYRRWNSYIGNEVVACIELIQQGKHADGSHE